MILFVSDMHFGQGAPADDRRLEADFIACLRHLEDRAEALYLVGDVFDQYIEYPTLVPKGFVRFQALLADWTDRGIPVTYLVGNHDPWHRDYYERELGVRVVFDDVSAAHHGRVVYLAHGDGIGASARWYNGLKPLLRHPAPVWLYRSVLPGDLGFRLARWYSRTFGTEELLPDRVADLRAHARRQLAGRPADLVVMGHSHVAECTVWPEGAYLNPGCWRETRTLGLLDETGPQLVRWNGKALVGVDTHVLSSLPAEPST